jgi:8-oxo-dGTP diphosphatase
VLDPESMLSHLYFMKQILVSAAVILDKQGRILLAQRPEGKSMAGLWEFPGGKVEGGETPEAALVRELQEEIGITVTSHSPLTFASHSYEGFHLLMPLYLCREWQGTPEGREGQALAWATLKALRDYPMPPADAPLLTFLEKTLPVIEPSY